jgi:hypothetical protein
MFYVCNGKGFKIDFTKLNFVPKRTSWFNPRNGQKKTINTSHFNTLSTFYPLGKIKNEYDWVLILEK